MRLILTILLLAVVSLSLSAAEDHRHHRHCPSIIKSSIRYEDRKRGWAPYRGSPLNPSYNDPSYNDRKSDILWLRMTNNTGFNGKVRNIGLHSDFSDRNKPGVYAYGAVHTPLDDGVIEKVPSGTDKRAGTPWAKTNRSPKEEAELSRGVLERLLLKDDYFHYKTSLEKLREEKARNTRSIRRWPENRVEENRIAGKSEDMIAQHSEEFPPLVIYGKHFPPRENRNTKTSARRSGNVHRRLPPCYHRREYN